MSEDVIRVLVDTTELDEAIAKAKQLITFSTQTFGTRNLSLGSKKFQRDWLSFWTLAEKPMRDIPRFIDELGVQDLPGINRELRLIVGQIPGMRMMISHYFRLKRIQRSIALGTAEAVTMREFLLHPSVLLTVMATAVLLIRTVLQHQERMRKERRDYEQLIRSYKGWTHQEWLVEREREGVYTRRFPG